MNSAIMYKLLGFCLLLLFLLGGCSAAGQQAATPVAAVTETTAPVNEFVTATLLPTAMPATTTPSMAASNVSSTQDKASFVGENYPDNSIFKPGETFVKTWEIKNVGATTWTTGYQLVLSASPQGETLGTPAQLNFPNLVAPQEKLSLSVPLVAPSSTGSYTVYWSIKNENGETVEVDGSNLWVTILVCEPNQPCGVPSSTGAVTANGVTASLSDFSYGSGVATVKICMSVSLQTYVLDKAPSLLVDQNPVAFASGGSDFANGLGCMEMEYQVSSEAIEQAQHVSLLIDGSLRMSPPAGDPDVACQTARGHLIAQYPGLDFTCKFTAAGYITNLQVPDGMTREHANALILDTIEGAIYGPWILPIK